MFCAPRSGPDVPLSRIAVVGSGGAGKSVFARKLGALCNLPVFHLDALLWKPNWVTSTPAEEDRILRDLVDRPSWIIDGNYGRTMPMRLCAADTIILLDLAPWLCTARILKRCFDHIGETRADMAEGCLEEGDWQFMKWVWNFRRDSRPAIMKRIEQFAAGKRVCILRSRVAIERYLEQVRQLRRP
jgi:adenylate kinase family enzyme